MRRNFIWSMYLSMEVYPSWQFSTKTAPLIHFYIRSRMSLINSQTRHLQAPSNPILSLLNVVGIIGSGILGALYTLAQKDRTTTEATIELLKNKVIEKDAAMVSQRKQFEKKLLSEQEEKVRQNRGMSVLLNPDPASRVGALIEIV